MTDRRLQSRPKVSQAGDPTPTGTLAIFDLDRTLLPGSSLLAFGRAMAAAGLVTRRRLARAVMQEARCRRRSSRDGEVDELRADALGHVAGLERAPLVQDVTRALVGSVTPGARLVLDRHLRAGDFVVVLSASPQDLVDAVARAWPILRFA